MSQAAQAYKLFSDGKSAVDVAIALNLRQAEVTELYKEYWNLKNLYDLNQVYEEIKGDISSFAIITTTSNTPMNVDTTNKVQNNNSNSNYNSKGINITQNRSRWPICAYQWQQPK
jgi:predicted nucleotidyltransferase